MALSGAARMLATMRSKPAPRAIAAPLLGELAQREQTAARGLVAAGAEGGAGLDQDRDAAGRRRRAHVRAGKIEWPGLDGG